MVSASEDRTFKVRQRAGRHTGLMQEQCSVVLRLALFFHGSDAYTTQGRVRLGLVAGREWKAGNRQVNMRCWMM